MNILTLDLSKTISFLHGEELSEGVVVKVGKDHYVVQCGDDEVYWVAPSSIVLF